MRAVRFAEIRWDRFDEGAKNYYRQQLQPVLENVSAADLCVVGHLDVAPMPGS
jgi:hypothetical protein